MLSQTRVACAPLKKEWQRFELETKRRVVWLHGEKSTVLPYTPLTLTTQVVPLTTTSPNSSKRLVTAKFTVVTSTVSLTSNSPVYSGPSCYKYLLIVFCSVPLVLLPFDSALSTETDSEHAIQSNFAPAAGQEMPAVRVSLSGGVRFETRQADTRILLHWTT